MFALGKLSQITRGEWLFLILSTLMLHSGTPLVAELFFEIYHLTGFEWSYSAYGAVRYVTSYYMVWPNRGMLVVAISLLLFTVILWRAHRRQGK